VLLRQDCICNGQKKQKKKGGSECQIHLDVIKQKRAQLEIESVKSVKCASICVTVQTVHRQRVRRQTERLKHLLKRRRSIKQKHSLNIHLFQGEVFAVSENDSFVWLSLQLLLDELEQMLFVHDGTVMHVSVHLCKKKHEGKASKNEKEFLTFRTL
jgi:hypothetical protein